MKKIGIFCVLVLVCSLPLGAQNLIPNPGFEEGMNIGHNLVAINGSDVVFSGTDTEVFQGDSALKLDISVVGTGGPQVIGVRHTIAGLEAGQNYSFRAAVKGPVGQKFRFRVHGDSKQTMNITVSSNAYMLYEFVLEPLLSAADGDHLVAIEFANTDNSAGTWYIDSLVLEKIDGGGGGDPGTLSVVFVSPNGLDTNDGSKLSPLKTVSKAAEMLAGDTIYLLEGSYHEEVSLTNFSGTEGAPKVITAYPGHEVTFDGTIPIETTWELYKDNIYKTTITEDIWQLFVNGEMLNLCRWPNVNGYIEDEQPVSPDPLPLSLWDQPGTWGHSADNSTNGVMIDDGGKGLGASGLDMTGAIAVLNVGSFKTSAAPVSSHTIGEDQFSYDPTYTDPFLSWQKPNHAYYYLEGKLDLLDTYGEWFYDQSTKELYLMTKDGSSPQGADIRGKNQSYAFSISGSDYLELRNIHFWGTSIKVSGSEYHTVENCEFSYPSYSKRILGDYSVTDVTLINNGSHHLLFKNNVIQYTEGEALHHEGTNSTIENNLMRHIDFSCVNLYRIGGTVNFIGDSNNFRNNTIYIAGASETVTPGSNNFVEGNEIWSIGHLQNDGAMIQYMVGPTVGSVTRNNWLHDCTKMGMRYDGSLDVGNTGIPGVWDPWESQTKGLVYGNAIWNTVSGLMIKGDYHVIVNNTVFDNQKVGIIMMNKPPDGANHNSICKNNVASMISGYRGGANPDDYPIPGEHSNNWNGYYQDEELREILSDIGNRDFRPVSHDLLIKKGSLEINSNDLFPEHPFIDSTYDIGAYEHGDSIYNIAGRREALPTHPIPADAAVSNASNIMMAWRPAYQASNYDVYAGSSLSAVSEATPESAEYRGEQVYNTYFPETTNLGEQVFWRVDPHIGEEVFKGDVWSYYAGLDTTTVVTDTLSNIAFIILEEGMAVENAEVILEGQSKLSDSFGEVIYTDFENSFSYNYSIQKSGYVTVEGVVYLERDTTITINIELETGMDINGLFTAEVYPNPANDVLQISSSRKIIGLDIVNAYGQVVLSEKKNNDMGRMDISTVSPGVYMLLITDQKTNRIWETIVITR